MGRIFALILALQGFAAGAAEITVLSSGGIRPPLEELASQFERASGHKVALKFVVGARVKPEAEAGAFDVVVAPTNTFEELIKAGKVVAATRADVARAGVGVAVRAGAPKPDVGSVEAFKRTLLNARSVAYNKEGTAGAYFLELLHRLGISNEMQPKLKPTVGTDPARSTFALVANGEAEIGVAAMSTIFAPGVDFVGPVPSALQAYTQFTAGVGSGAKEPQAAAAFIKFVTAPAAGAVFRAKGMDPVAHRH
jgi:molybdate transport system substrate-binding protein